MSREAMQMALEALEGNCTNPSADPEQSEKEDAAITALRQALETEQEPVAWMHTTAAGLVYFRKKPQDKVFNPQAVYTAPPKREWVGLTDAEHDNIKHNYHNMTWTLEMFARAIEAKLKERNHG